MSVFISHSGKNKAQIKLILAHLPQQPARTWLDEKDLWAGRKVEAALRKAIDIAELFVVFMSKDSVASTWVQRKLNGPWSGNGILATTSSFPSC